MSNNIMIKCPKCCGSGMVQLSDELEKTLDVLKSLGSATAKQVFEALQNEHIGETAINNRLEDLKNLGLVERERQGKRFVYKAKEI